MTQECCLPLTILNLQTRLFLFVPDVWVRTQKCTASEEQSKHMHNNCVASLGLILFGIFTMTPRQLVREGGCIKTILRSICQNIYFFIELLHMWMGRHKLPQEPPHLHEERSKCCKRSCISCLVARHYSRHYDNSSRLPDVAQFDVISNDETFGKRGTPCQPP